MPYGEERWTDGASPTDFGFTSQRAEAGFGLYDYNARYYSPALGRFVSPDTIVPEPGSSQGWNRYAYVKNNPLKNSDPTGHMAVCGTSCEDYRNNDPSQPPPDEPEKGIALQLVKLGVPTTIGMKGDIALSGDIIFGLDISLDHTVAWNWYSGEIGLIEGKNLGFSGGLPQGIGVNGSIGLRLGHGATELDSFAGSSTVLNGSAQVDEFVKVGVSGSWAVATDKTGNLIYDPESKMPITDEYIGVSGGLNTIANVADIRVGTSPGTNHSTVINSGQDFWNFVDDVKSLRYFKSFTSQ